MEQNTIWNKTANYVISDPGSLFCFLHQKNLADSPFYNFFFFFLITPIDSKDGFQSQNHHWKIKAWFKSHFLL